MTENVQLTGNVEPRLFKSEACESPLLSEGFLTPLSSSVSEVCVEPEFSPELTAAWWKQLELSCRPARNLEGLDLDELGDWLRDEIRANEIRRGYKNM